MIGKTKKAINFVTHDIWIKNESEYKSPRTRWWVHQAKVFIYTINGVGSHNVTVRSAALTFYTVMSLVPILALIFGITKGFGLEEWLDDYLSTEFADYQPLIDRLTVFANAMLQRARGGIIAAVGVLVLFWSVIKVFGNIEDAFNRIWDVRKSRAITRKVTDYLSMVLVTPLLLIASNSFMLQVRSQLINFNLSIVGEILFTVSSLVVTWITFTCLYKIMPNTKVNLKSALIAGIAAGTLFLSFQYAYFWIQSQVSNYNAIYGSFAAIPLFLIWLQASWQIVLLGAELSFAHQNVKNFEYEKISENISYDFRRKIIVIVMQEVAKHYIKNEGPVSSTMIADSLNLPIRMIRDAVYQLLKAGLIIVVNNDDDRVHFYVPSSDIHEITISSVIKAVETTGENTKVFEENIELQPIERIIKKFDRMIENSDSNKLLVDIPDSKLRTNRSANRQKTRKAKETAIAAKPDKNDEGFQ